MTVIVQPMTMPPPETASDVIAQHLQKLLGTLTYENFAATSHGNITILDTTFYYRVGLFLAVPTEAIIAAGQFVKMHQIKEKAKYWTGLKVIDPDKPDDCLYERYSVNFDTLEKGWCPPALGAGQGTSPGTIYVQQSVLTHHGIAGIGQSGQPQWPNTAAQQKATPTIPYSPPTLWGKIFGTP